tara:strand:- start:490 stop:753 length:264 start_codon:yes stop_codon:yes gene_type:complete
MEAYFIEIILGIGGALCTAIGALWRIQVSNHIKVEDKLGVSEEQQVQTLKEIGDIKERLGIEKGRNDALILAHADVLQTVTKAILNK